MNQNSLTTYRVERYITRYVPHRGLYFANTSLITVYANLQTEQEVRDRLLGTLEIQGTLVGLLVTLAQHNGMVIEQRSANSWLIAHPQGNDHE